MQKRRINLLLLYLSLFFPLTAFSLPQRIDPPGERMVLVDPVAHQWGAYEADGTLIKYGLASAGADYCPDMESQCHTVTGSYRVRKIGDASCVSPSFPIPNGGAPMPYCMYFTEYQALHGSYELANGNISHGCVRMHVADARWLHNNFVRVGTLVVIEPY